MFNRIVFDRILHATILIAATLVVAPAFAQSTRPVPTSAGHAPHGYWLSEGLNRIVFWKLPDASRPAQNRQQPAECRACF